MADDPRIRDLALRGLDASVQVDELSSSTDGEVHPPSIGDLYRYVVGVPGHDDLYVQSAIDDDPRVRRDFESLLKNTAYATMPRLAAAAGDAVRERQHDGYVLKLTVSTVEPDQYYLGIETGVDVTALPNRLYLRTDAGDLYTLVVPPMTNGRAQLTLDKSAPEVHAFGQPDTVIYIR